LGGGLLKFDKLQANSVFIWPYLDKLSAPFSKSAKFLREAYKGFPVRICDNSAPNRAVCGFDFVPDIEGLHGRIIEKTN
jgi:hypothetical protein